VLTVAKVRAFGETVDALRVSDKQPTAAPAKIDLNPSHEKWQGAIDALKSGKTTLDWVKANYTLSDTNLKLLQDAVTSV
jgi:hypothetical protein